MNKAHRIVWNAVTGTWTAVAEIAKGRSKGTGRAALTVIATVVALGALPGTVAAAEDCTTADGKAGTTDAAGACVVPSTTGKLLGASLLGASDSTVINIQASGTSPVAKNTGDVAIGSETVADSSGGASDHAATAVGYGARAVGARTVALGMYANASATDALAFGYKGTASAAGAVAIGAGSSASGTNSVALGFGSVANRANTVSVGSTTATRQIVNVAAGSEETDAVNVKQLKDVGIKLDSSGYVTNTFVAYDDMTKGSATLGGASGTTLKNVKAGEVSVSSSDAVNGSQLYTTNESVDKNTKDISTLKTAITNIDSGSIGLVQQDATSHAITVASATAGTTVDFTGTAGARQLKGVSKGTADTDAVNVAQLNDVDTRAQDGISGLNGDMASVKDGISGLNGDMASVKDGINGLNGDMASVKDGVNGLNGEMASVKDGIDGINGSITSITNQITSGELGLVQQDATTRNLTVAANTDGAAVDFTGTAGTRQLKGVSAGADDTDAVNVAQMKDVDTRAQDGINGLNGDMASVKDGVNGLNGDMASVKDGINGLNGEMASVKDGIDGINGSITSITNQINNGELGLVQQDQTTRDLTVASDKDGAHVNFAGTAGSRELIGVAAGTTSNSAVNVGQLSPVVASLGGDAQVNADGSVTGPTYHVQGGTQNTVGGALNSLDNGLSTLQTQINNGSIGMVTQNQTSRDILVGAATDGLRVNMAGTAGNRVVTGVAAGAVNASSSDAVNGAQLHANAKSTADALGGGSTVNEDGTISMPTYNVGGTTVNGVGAAITNIDGRVTQNTSDIASLQTTVGTMSGSVANAVSYDSAAHNQVTLGGSASAPKVKLTNLQDGELSATSSDAVTGSQLWNTNQQVANLNQAVQNQQSTGSSSIATDTGGPAASATGSGSMAMGGGAQASGDNSVALGAGSVADQANTVSVGSPGNERRITNVADGQGPTDAVNMRQFQQGIGSVARNAYSGVAAATALTMIPDVDPGKTIAVGIGTGNYKGYQAVSLGMSARITQNLKIKAGAGMSSADTTYGVGAAYQW